MFILLIECILNFVQTLIKLFEFLKSDKYILQNFVQTTLFIFPSVPL